MHVVYTLDLFASSSVKYDRAYPGGTAGCRRIHVIQYKVVSTDAGFD